MRRLLVHTVIMAFSIGVHGLLAQNAVRTFGDASVRGSIDTRSRTTFDPSATRVERAFLLTSSRLLSLRQAGGSDATGTFVDGHVARVVVFSWTHDGKYSVEYYFDREALILVYETFTYFEDQAPPRAWRNFMGLAAWERRSYFDQGTIRYAETTGETGPTPGADGPALIHSARRLAHALESRPRVRLPQR